MQAYLFTLENVINHFKAKSYEDLENLTQEEVFEYFKDSLLQEKEAEEEQELAIILDGRNYDKSERAFRSRSHYMENVAEIEPYSRWLVYRDESGAIRYSEKAGATDHSGLFKRHSSFTREDYSPAQAIKVFDREADRLAPHRPPYNPMNHF
ncbi:Protein of unknown function [Lactobacillus equicursoris 66c]|uniref:Uncharacterized protein n=1 Tax=Lactobacillus equicursoris 66c TaxID=872326 RepID=K0NMN7_9LACO|nr:hypothetical protein [Lactobacillus equicursoris]CCK82924.1 Protein of unknown function [Lactobacillus equicursoris 66c]